MSKNPYYLALHPATLHLLVDAMHRDGLSIDRHRPAFTFDTFLGIPLKRDSRMPMPEMVEQWVPPRTKFITYEQCDKWYVWDVLKKGTMTYTPHVPIEIRNDTPVRPVHVDRVLVGPSSLYQHPAQRYVQSESHFHVVTDMFIATVTQVMERAVEEVKQELRRKSLAQPLTGETDKRRM